MYIVDGELCVLVFPHKGMAHRFANTLLAVCTTLSVLDDRAFGEEVPCLCEKIQNNTEGDKADNIVDEGTVGRAILDSETIFGARIGTHPQAIVNAPSSAACLMVL